MTRLVADVDTGIDDALALLWLAAQHRRGVLDLHVTTVAGNTSSVAAARNSAEVLRLAGVPEVPVTVGAARPSVVPLTTTPETHGPEGLGHHRPAVPVAQVEAEQGPGDADAAVAAWVAADPDLLLVAGPATNLAGAVETAPEVLRDTQVTVMGGAFLYPGNTTPTAEWNVWSDPHALAYCLDHWPTDSPPPVICPLNVTEQVLLTPHRLADWQAAVPGELGRFLGDALRFYMEFHEEVGVGHVAQIHDLAAATVLCGAVDVTLRDATVRVEADSALLRGTTVADWTGGTPQGEGRDGASGAVGAVGATGTDRALGPYWGRPTTARVLTALEPSQVMDSFRDALDVLRG